MAISKIPDTGYQIKQIVDSKSLGEFSTAAELNALLNNELAAMTNNTWRSIRVKAVATFDLFHDTYIYTGTLYRNGSASWSHVMLYSNARPDVISGEVQTSGTWSYRRLATADEVAAKASKNEATTSSAGLMSAADKAKLDTPETIIFPADRTLLNNAGYHNAIWRGKSLGGSLTSAQSAAITGGTFADLFLGDYWTINGVVWRIMGFDVFLSCGDNMLSSHHVVVVPDTNLYKCKWNETANTTDGGPNGGIGYAGSLVRANIKSSVNGEAEGAELKVIAAFGNDHVLSYRTIYPSAYDAEGNATTFANFDARVELMSEIMVYGSQIFTAHGIGNGYEAGIEKTQLPGFRVDLRRIKSADYWLRNPFTKTSVCEVGTYGNATRTNANLERGVRPFALIA